MTVRKGTDRLCTGSDGVSTCDMYKRYRKAAHSKDRRKVVRRVALVIGGIFDKRKLIAMLTAFSRQSPM
jgi:hypothetical protein